VRAVHRILGRFPIDGWIIKRPGSLSLSVHPYPARGAYERDATTLAPPRVATDWHAHTDPAGPNFLLFSPFVKDFHKYTFFGKISKN
jgi:hypothetical protein